MSFYDNRYYYINKTLLSFIGQWPLQSRLESNIMLLIMLFFTCSSTALELWGLIVGITDLSIIIENLSPLLMHSGIFIKIINSLYNKYKMKNLLEEIEKTWQIIQTEPERKILESYAEQTRTMTIQYTVLIYSMAVFYSMMPFIVKGIYSFLPSNDTNTNKFLFRLDHVIDIDKYFNLLMVHGVIGVFYIITVLIASDTMYTVCVQHVCALFKIICYNMKHIPDSDHQMHEPVRADDKSYHIIIKYIKSYKYALRFSNLLSSIYSICNFFLLGNVIISLSFSGAELIMVANRFDMIIRIIAAIMGQMIHIFNLSVISQRLIDHSSEVHEAIYSSEWYNFSLRSKQLLRFMLMRANKPCEMKAGDMYVMSMENFSSILQVSMSYFTMLTSMQI